MNPSLCESRTATLLCPSAAEEVHRDVLYVLVFGDVITNKVRNKDTCNRGTLLDCHFFVVKLEG
jgi:hypothetical protein